MRIKYIALIIAALFIPIAASAEPKAKIEKEIDYEAYYKKAGELNSLRKERTIGVNKLLEMKEDKKTIILDVRSKLSYECSHIDGAINIPYSDIKEGTLESIIPNKDTRVVIYCDNGIEEMITRVMPLSMQAFPLLYQLGYQNIYELESSVRSKPEDRKKLPLKKNDKYKGNCE